MCFAKGKKFVGYLNRDGKLLDDSTMFQWSFVFCPRMY